MLISRKSLKPYKETAWLFEKEDGSEDTLWVSFFATLFRDPAFPEQKIIATELLDITRQVEQEEFVKASRKREHALLQSMIPEHIIDFLVEEKRSARAARGSPPRSALWPDKLEGKSHSDEGLLSSLDVQGLSGNRVASLAEHHSAVTVLFTDIVGFTKMASQSNPADIMKMLNNIFTMFDECSEKNEVYKVETIGDAYMCAAGLMLSRHGHPGSAATEGSGEVEDMESLIDCSGRSVCACDPLRLASSDH